MTTEIESLGPKQTAQVLRGILRQTFPATKFSVVTERGSMMSSVRVSWTDGPTASLVKAITNRFEAGHFDGMTDSYDYAPLADRTLLIDGKVFRAGTQYVSEERKISAKFANKCIAKVAAYWGRVAEVPTAVEGYFGFDLEPKGIGRKPVRDGLDIHDDWHSSIYRAASDATEYAQSAK